MGMNSSRRDISILIIDEYTGKIVSSIEDLQELYFKLRKTNHGKNQNIGQIILI